MQITPCRFSLSRDAKFATRLAFVMLFLFLGITQSAMAQKKAKNDSLPSIPDSVAEKLHSPTKAAVMSMVLPGLGQIYNKKYWKLPIVYAGFGIMTYFIVTNANNYMIYQSAYIEETNGVTEGNYAYYVNRYTESELLSAREYYRRNMEISILITGVWYALTILDATVDAHLMTFNVSKDLSMKVSPALLPSVMGPAPSAGITLSLKIK
jgi:hypothetical protein